MLSVGDCITNDGLQEGFEDTTSLFVDHGRDTLDTTTTSETSDSWLGDTLDVVAKNLAMTLSTSLAEALAALSACEKQVLVYSTSNMLYHCGQDEVMSSGVQHAMSQLWSRSAELKSTATTTCTRHDNSDNNDKSNRMEILTSSHVC